MAEESGDRVTLALVYAELKGTRDWMDARFSDVQRQIDHVSKLPTEVAILKQRAEENARILKAHDRKFEEFEAAEDKKRDWRLGPFVAHMIGACGVITAIVVAVSSQ